MKPTRVFSANLGDPSTGTGGPDQIEKDFDVINKMFDPLVTHDDASSGGIGNANIQDNAIGTTKVQDNAISTIKVQDNAISTTKIPDNAITTPKILDNAITDTKIGNRTPDENIATAFTGTSDLVTLLSIIAKQLKAITGETGWYVAPQNSTLGNAVSITNKADKTDTYTKTEVYTKTETDTAIAGVALGTLPNGSIDDIKLSDTAGAIKDRVTQLEAKMIIENRIDDPISPEVGRIWFRTDL